MATVSAPWYVAAGWALDLFTGGGARAHHDIEIAVPRDCFDQVLAAFGHYEWDVVGDGQAGPYPEGSDRHHQTWLRDPSTGSYHLDVFREPHRGELWVCRRDSSITLPFQQLILHTDTGIPYAIPELALLFKAKYLRGKDQADFDRVLPALDNIRRARLSDWLHRVHPGHPWLDALRTGRT